MRIRGKKRKAITLGQCQKLQWPQLLRNPLSWFSESNIRWHAAEEHCCKISALSMGPTQF